MIFNATNIIAKAFEEANLKCEIRELGDYSFVETGFSGDNCTFKLRFFSTDNDNDVKVLTEEFAKYPEDKLEEGYVVMNELSRKYRYLKFTLDKDDGAVSAQYDFPVALPEEALGKVAIEFAIRFSKIIDDAYPQIMRSIWQ